MTTQTKLTKDEKAEVRDLISDFTSQGGTLFYVPRVGMVVAMIPEFSGSRMANVGVSFAATSEKKFRKLVGARLAIYRADGTFAVPVQPEYFRDWVEYMADSMEGTGDPAYFDSDTDQV